MSWHKKYIAWTLFVITAVIFSGCSGDPSRGKDVVAYVNKDAIYKNDLRRDIALRARIDPSFKLTPESESDQLDAMIDRKIIIQYAMEKGLAREEHFVETIRSIWEHTLIRDFIEYKKKELRDYLFATDEDIKNYYEKMHYRVTFKVFKSRDKRAAEAAYERYIKDKDDSGWQTIGPIAYYQIEPMVLLDAFSMEEGSAGLFSDEPNYYVIAVSMKEKADVEPLEKLKPEIEKAVIAVKEKRMFEDWLKERKKKTKIVIKTENL